MQYPRFANAMYLFAFIPFSRHVRFGRSFEEEEPFDKSIIASERHFARKLVVLEKRFYNFRLGRVKNKRFRRIGFV